MNDVRSGPVSSNGRVTNVKVVATNQAGYFEEKSIAAAKRFIYFPRIVDGVPMTVTGVQNRFTFMLDK